MKLYIIQIKKDASQAKEWVKLVKDEKYKNKESMLNWIETQQKKYKVFFLACFLLGSETEISSLQKAAADNDNIGIIDALSIDEVGKEGVISDLRK